MTDDYTMDVPDQGRHCELCRRQSIAALIGISPLLLAVALWTAVYVVVTL